MRILNYALLSLLVLLGLSCKGSKESVDQVEEVKPKPTMSNALPNGQQSLFWEIRKEGVEEPSYLFGTIHVISNDDYFMGERVVEKLSQSDHLVMELDFDNMDMGAIASMGLLPDEKTMSDYLSEADYDYISTVLSDSIGLSKMAFENAYSRMKPIFMEQLVIFRFLGENPVSYESNFDLMADKHGIKTSGLETFEEQLEFLDQIPLEQQFEDLKDAITNWGETRSQFQELVNAYVAQDLIRLNELIEVEMAGTETQDLLLNKRNENWIPQLQEIIEAGNAFIAVGAGHLGGDNGVINLLRNAGYEVWPSEAGEHVGF